MTEGWQPEMERVRVKTKHTFLHFSEECTPSTDHVGYTKSAQDIVRERRSVSDNTYTQLVPISPLLGAKAAPGSPASLVPIDKAADHTPRRSGLHVMDLESALTLSPGAASRHLPTSLIEESAGADDSGSCFVPATPSPLLHASLRPEILPPDFFMGDCCDLPPDFWNYGASLFGDSAELGLLPPFDENWALDVAYQSGWDPATAGFPGTEGWDMQLQVPLDPSGCWDQATNEEGPPPWWSGEQVDASMWTDPPAADAGWAVEPLEEGKAAPGEGGDKGGRSHWWADCKHDGPETPEKVTKQKKKAGRADGPLKAEEKTHAENGGSDARKSAVELSGTDTTVMLRNIPNKYSRDMLADQLNVDYHGMFDFMYLPIDFKNKCNVGYGFVNFRTADLCTKFVNSFNGVKVSSCLPGFNSKKIVEVTPARVQGMQENVRRLRNSPVMGQLKDNPDWMPLVFDEDGKEMPFPEPEHPLPPVRARGSGRHKDGQR